MATPVPIQAEGAVTMADVAARAGVSIATVSRVLNNKFTVSPTLRTRVEVTVQELGYRPNRLARNLRRQQAEMIGVVVSDIENPHFAEMIHAAEGEASRSGYRVLLCNTDEQRDKQASYLQMLADERPLGVILVPCDPRGAEIGELLDLGIPVVAFDRPVGDRRADAVLADNVAAARAAVEHLVETGHRKIGFVGTSPDVATGSERLAGYRAAMAEAGLEPRSVNGGFRVASGERAVGELLQKYPDTDAIIAGNNLIGVGVLRALRERGIGIPNDIGLVCFDDPFWSELMDPALTAISQPVREMVAATVRLLLDRIEGRNRAPKKVVFALELMVRASSLPRAQESQGSGLNEGPPTRGASS